MKFKIGDKVKISAKFPDSHMVGKMCQVIAVRKHPPFDYDIRFIQNHRWWSPVYEHELESIFVKGEQLLFSFMDVV